MRAVNKLLSILIFCSIGWSASAHVETLEATAHSASQASSKTAASPKAKDVILTVSGNVDDSLPEGELHLTLAQLQNLPQHTYVTDNPWIREPQHFKGPKLKDVLKLAGARSTELMLEALNDYHVELDFAEIERFDPILAWSNNDKVMTVRNKGPLWLMFNIDSQPVLDELHFNDYMIWQLSHIFVND